MPMFTQTSALPRLSRDRYLASLREPQEWFLEELVRDGEVWEVPGKAYAVFHAATLVEFHVEDAATASQHLTHLRTCRPFETALCKSFDPTLLNAAKSLGCRVQDAAFLFRKRVPVEWPRPEGFQIVKAQAHDVDPALRLGGDFFAGLDDVERLFATGDLWIARQNSQMVGCGVTYPLGTQVDAVDIGMVIGKDWRNRGFGVALVGALADLVERRGQRPICGCAKDNLASRATLEKAGFVSEHRLFRLEFPA